MASQEKGMQTEEALEETGAPRVYELGFHIDAELPQEEVKKTYQGIRNAISENGTIVAEGEPQSMPLAYTISRQETAGRRDFNTAFFAWIVYEAPTDTHAEIISGIKENNRIIRFIDLVTTKEEALHFAQMQEMQMKTPEDVENEDVVDSELDAALEEATS